MLERPHIEFIQAQMLPWRRLAPGTARPDAEYKFLSRDGGDGACWADGTAIDRTPQSIAAERRRQDLSVFPRMIYLLLPPPPPPPPPPLRERMLDAPRLLLDWAREPL